MNAAVNALELRDVSVSRGAGPVIREVSLDVTPGTITALVGPNGAGKTSLLEAVSGVIPMSSGTVTVGGTAVNKLSRVARSKLGLVHIEQGRAVFPSLTVMENLRLAASSAADVDDALQMFPELQKRHNARTEVLSGGEQQMVVLARAFASKPSFLLIDEMSLGLAPVVFTRLLPVVRRFAEKGVGILLVEQFTHLALGMAQEALVVASGRVTYRGDAQTLIDSPETLHSAYLG